MGVTTKDFANQTTEFNMAPPLIRFFKLRSENLEMIKVERTEKVRATEESAPRETYFSLKINMKTNRGQIIVPILDSIPLPI